MKNLLLIAAIICSLSSCYKELAPEIIPQIPILTDPTFINGPNIFCEEMVILDYEPNTNLSQLIPHRIEPKQPSQNALLNALYDFDNYSLRMWSDSLFILNVDEIEILNEYTDPLEVLKNGDTIVVNFTEQMNEVVEENDQIQVGGISIICY